MKIAKRGAEAVIYLSGKSVVKERVRKGYRLEEIDQKLRKLRTRKEARLIEAARRAGVCAPRIDSVSEIGCKITMESIEGERLREFFNKATEASRKKVAQEVGRAVGLIHKAGIVHGDLTTSNMILKDGSVFLIDFGLGDFSRRAETQAIDLSVFREALKSTHFNYLNVLWESFIKGYRQTNDNFNKVLDALNGIEKRGRYVER